MMMVVGACVRAFVGQTHDGCVCKLLSLVHVQALLSMRLGASMCEEMKSTSTTLTMVASLVVPQTRDERRGGSRQEGKEARGECRLDQN